MHGLRKIICLCLLTCGMLSAASTLKHANDEDNEIEREKRQMKGSTSAGAPQAEVKFLSAAPILAATASGVLQAANGALNANNLQGARYAPLGNGLMQQGGYASIPGLNYGGLNGLGSINGALPLNGVGSVGVSGNLNYPSGLEMFPGLMYGGGLYPNAGAPIGIAGIPTPLGGPLEQFGGPQGGLSTQLLAQPSQLQPQQIPPPYPVMPGFYSQMGYGPAFQNFLG